MQHPCCDLKECPPRHVVVLLCGAHVDTTLLYHRILREMRLDYEITCIDQRDEIGKFHCKKTASAPWRGHRDEFDYAALDAKYRKECGEHIWAQRVCGYDFLDNFRGALFVPGAEAGDAPYFEQFYRHVMVASILPTQCGTVVALGNERIAEPPYTAAVEISRRVMVHFDRTSTSGQ